MPSVVRRGGGAPKGLGPLSNPVDQDDCRGEGVRRPHIPHKVPRGDRKRRRRLLARRRSIAARAVEINSVAPRHRQYSHADRTFMTREVRRMLALRPAGASDQGLSNAEGNLFEIMLRRDGLRGSFLVIAGFLRMIACIFIDAATLIEIVEFDVPGVDRPVGNVPHADEPRVGEVLVEVNCTTTCLWQTRTSRTWRRRTQTTARWQKGMALKNMTPQRSLKCLTSMRVRSLRVMALPLSTAVTMPMGKIKSIAGAIKWLSRSHQELLGGLKQCVIRATKSKLAVLVTFGKQLMAWLQAAGKWPKRSLGGDMVQLRRLRRTIRNVACHHARQAKATCASKERGHTSDEMSLVQKDLGVWQIDPDLAFDHDNW